MAEIFYRQLVVEGDHVRAEKRLDGNNRPYCVYYRRGYPPIVRRLQQTSEDIARICRNDSVIALR